MLTIRLQYIDIKLGYAYHNKCSSHFELGNALSGCAADYVVTASNKAAFYKRKKVKKGVRFLKVPHYLIAIICH